ncbi:NAD(P)-dependent oxidoreductase [Brevibacillus parabrevis]|uniref:NAD(P)-dependent oxidoreductase n=1 Tax=Brevibacillus parabrevis TaxID=54914 RepID=UPI001C24E003|nr:NAD(P)-dependent oxidoreductase [Brevibacillus parabrevis]MBU8714860.1 NAD(P)-dependent oxidoreductase [Brevibacillus parabrevis]MED2253175.1 NAD(P)-dependent oxidoreductase [Brevibacillus parabrevis]WDV98157.1 NAD(P)-dependent oxidoreductase [Brevibacillus parabrevis]
MPAIGMIGLGNMGMPMSKNLLGSGYAVYGFDVNPDAEKEFAAAGGVAGLTIEEVVKQTEVVLTSLPSPGIVESVYTGAGGILEHARAGQILVDTSTVTPGLNERLAVACQAKGVGYLAAPVSGGVIGAKNRTLTIMVGGPKNLYDQMQPIFAALGQNIFHVGARVDSGTAVKLINNLLIGFYTSAVSEGVTLAAQMGLDLDQLFEILNVSYGQSRIYERNYKSFIATNDFAPHFSLNLLLKDLKIAQEMAHQAGLDLPITAELISLYEKSQQAGFGEQDMAALYSYVQAAQRKIQA